MSDDQIAHIRHAQECLQEALRMRHLKTKDIEAILDYCYHALAIGKT